jgi:hypothetical protein
MAVNVSVDATWRMTRFEFNAPHTPSGMVSGYSEVLLQAPAKPTKGAEFMRSRMPAPAPQEGDDKVTYGVMPGSMISRAMTSVMDETVTVDGKTVAFKDVVAASVAFFEKWRVEDENKPPPAPAITAPMPGDSGSIPLPPS